MAVLRPYPFGPLVSRMFRELDARRAIFDLPERKFFLGDPGCDLSVSFHGHVAATPLGPAAGPQSQMAQNIVLSWLGGSRILELKTVQVNDQLDIPRPCIDMQTVGYNVEWSQELTLEESLEEYVKGAMLVEMLSASGELDVAPGWDRTLYDMSVGYDLAGIRSPRVQEFIHGMLDCSAVVDRLRGEIPAPFKRFRDLDFATRLSDTLTLSTFHGCPPDEIERIVSFLLEENGLHCIVKLNPMLLGRDEVRELLNGVLGYDDVRCPDSAFERDTKWEDAQGFVERLGEQAAALGLGFGVKFTNTLIVENHRGFFPPGEKEMYLSGPPLHVLAMNLVRVFRQRFQDRYPISFSAGIDRKNFPDAVALGLVPVTVCSDLLKPGGYGRSRGYFDELLARMERVGATTVEDFVLRAYGLAADALARVECDAAGRSELARRFESGTDLRGGTGHALADRWLSEAKLLNTRVYVKGLAADPRYAKAHNSKVPKKIGSALELLDCISCDKCVPVCPNDANFSLALEPCEVPLIKVRHEGGEWRTRADGVLKLERPRQWANFADFCNDCGNCDVFCPEDGGPYVVKPRFFGRLDDWAAMKQLDGFHVQRVDAGIEMHGRFAGREVVLLSSEGGTRFSGEGFSLLLETGRTPTVLEGDAREEVDLAPFLIMTWLLDAVCAEGAMNYVSAELDSPYGRSGPDPVESG